MQFPADTYKQAGMNATDVAVLFKVTRITSYKWLKGQGVHPLLQEKVARLTLTVAALRAAGTLPHRPPGRVSAGQRASETARLVTQAAG